MVYAARGADVVHSVINGKVIMQNREIRTLNERAILADMMNMGEQIRKMRE
jgi:5-methylthioadenosine/S-adenosylhomocysteine deaminase